MNDLQMTRDGDLCIKDNDILTTDSIEQGIFIRLRWFFNEWQFGPDYGVRYFEDILVKNPNTQLIIREISEQILAVDGVSSVDSVEVEIDSALRSATIRYSVTTESQERFEKEVSIWSTV